MVNHLGKEFRVLRGALTDVLADESYTIPTEEAKCCLLIVQKLVSILGEPSTKWTKFSLWLVGGLKNIIRTQSNIMD